MDNSVEELILQEIRGFRKDMKNYGERITSMETRLKPLFDNGQPGMLTKLQTEMDTKADVSELDDLSSKVEDLETHKNRFLGAIAVLSTIFIALLADVIRLHLNLPAK